MRIGVNGVLVSQNGEVLLIQRNDTRTFAPPGGTLDVGELPPDGAARETQEETGLIVLPVRLVTLNFWRASTHYYLSLTFRCLLRGGEITPSAESPHVGFYDSRKLPRPMASIHKERVEVALKHAGGPVIWWSQGQDLAMRVGSFLLQNGVYRYYDWQRKRRGEPLFEPPASWEISVFVLVQNEAGDVLLVQDEGWQLPGGVTPSDVAPWETAVSLTHAQTNQTIQLTNLKSFYVAEDEAKATLIFSATTNTTEGNWFKVDALPQDTAVSQQTFIQNTRLPGDETTFYYL